MAMASTFLWRQRPEPGDLPLGRRTGYNFGVLLI
jgi:hypothetical protein